MKFGDIDKTDFFIPPFALFYFYVVLAAAFNWPTVNTQEFFHSEIISWTGVLFCFAGLLLLLWSVVSFRQSFRVGIDADHPDRLITDGVFAFSRNPIYVAFAILLIGEFFILPNWITLIYIAAATWLFHRQVLREEDYLRRHYRTMLVELQRWRDSVDRLNDDTLVSLVDLVALDLEDIIPFSDKLAVRRIRGGVFIERDPSTYSLVVTGPHFGGDTAGMTTKWDVSLNDVKLSKPDLRPPIDAIFTTKEEVLRDSFNKDKIVVLPLVIHITRSESRPMESLRGPRIQEITLTYKVSLLPKYAGTVTVNSEYPDYEWRPKGTVSPIAVSVRDDQAQTGFRWTRSVCIVR
jgi:protein-S-isoprenylcysteine O-methyltransferase Ste14